MIERVTDLPYRIVDASGSEYYSSVAAEQRADGVWEAWLEYVPTDDSEPLVTPTETTQSTRADVVRWADALTDTYVEGAFDRAAEAAVRDIASHRATNGRGLGQSSCSPEALIAKNSERQRRFESARSDTETARKEEHVLRSVVDIRREGIGVRQVHERVVTKLGELPEERLVTPRTLEQQDRPPVGDR